MCSVFLYADINLLIFFILCMLLLWLQKVDSLKSMLEKKEKELFALESKLSSRERVSPGICLLFNAIK